MIDVNICLSPTVIRKYLWFNIHMDSYLPITFWYIIYIQKQYLCWIFVSLKMFTPNLQYSYQTGLEWLKEGVKSIFLNDSRSFWSTHVQEDNKPALENHSLCRTPHGSSGRSTTAPWVQPSDYMNAAISLCTPYLLSPPPPTNIYILSQYWLYSSFPFSIFFSNSIH